MRHSSLLLCAGLITLGSFAACGSDDGSKKVQDGEAGAGGGDAGGGGEPSSGGSNSPAAGEGGVPAASGQGGANAGAPPLSMAGEGGASEGGSAGMSVAAGAAGDGGTGGAPLDCPAQPGTFMYQCGEISELQNPLFDLDTGTLSLQISTLQYPIKSGAVSYFYEGLDSTECGTTSDVVGVGSDVTVQIPLTFTPSRIRITAIDLVDACDGHHEFDQTGIACYELVGVGGSGSTALDCQPAPGACPGLCE